MDPKFSHSFGSYSDQFLRLKEDLFPGIPNEVTLELITTKLQWRAFLVLSSVSRVWQQAIRNSLIYDGRVRSGSTESLVVLNHNGSDETYGIGIYSFTDKALYPLPPIAQLGNRFLPGCNCISLDGKIYILGGFNYMKSLSTQEETGKGVYVLELARGRGQWKKCASMTKGRREAGCGIKCGKIYVFGGVSPGPDRFTVHGSEVYDPTADAWSEITHDSSLQCDHGVTTVGEELLVYGNGGQGYSRPFPIPLHSLRAYHPVKDEWRTLSENFRRYFNCGKSFMTQGKLYSMTEFGIYAYVLEGIWRKLHSFSFDEGIFGLVEEARAVLAVGDELLAIVSAYADVRDQNLSLAGWVGWDFSQFLSTYLVQSKGFGGKDKEIVWEKLSCWSDSVGPRDPFMISLQL